jgi:hypothetical protein
MVEHSRRRTRCSLPFLVAALVVRCADSTREEELRLVTQADVVLPDATGYRYLIPADYSIRLTLDPCRGHKYMCCNNTFGATEIYGNLKPLEAAPSPNEGTYAKSANAQQHELACSNRGLNCLTQGTEDGTNGPPLNPFYSRLQDEHIVYDATCTGGKVPHDACLDKNVARVRNPLNPPCWDYSDSVHANSTCRGINGTTMANCIEVGFLQTAFVVACGGASGHNLNCGTFLEVHRKDDGAILSESQLPAGFVSGFSVATVPMTHNYTLEHLLCAGEYELWWVKRVPGITSYGGAVGNGKNVKGIVEYKKGFTVTSPPCTWNPITATYSKYSVVEVFALRVQVDYGEQETISVRLPKGASVVQLKIAIHDQKALISPEEGQRYGVDEQILHYKGRLLLSSEMLADLSVGANAEVHLILRSHWDQHRTVERLMNNADPKDLGIGSQPIA